MKLKTREEYISDLKNDPYFQLILKSASDEEQRKMIENTALNFLTNITDSILPFAEYAQKNPDVLKKIIHQEKKNESAKKNDETLITLDNNKK